MDTVDEIKQMFPPDTPIMLRKHTIEGLDRIKDSIIKPELVSRDDTINFLRHYYESKEMGEK